jgi:hypothetical protein
MFKGGGDCTAEHRAGKLNCRERMQNLQDPTARARKKEKKTTSGNVCFIRCTREYR